VNFPRKLIILLLAISMFSILINGCTFVTPNYDDYIVSYIKVYPYSAIMKVNTSKIFKIWAYDAEDNLIPVDPSKVTWGATYQCWWCGKVWDFNPQSGSTSTYFTPQKAGKYYVYGHYKGKTDYSPVNVVQ